MIVNVKCMLLVFSVFGLMMIVLLVYVEGCLVVYCSVINVMCEVGIKVFVEKYNVNIFFVCNGLGSIFVKIDVEKNNLCVDVWYGGMFDL